MTCYLISYDAHKNRHYQNVYDLMRNWQAVWMTESCWLVNLNSTAKTVRDLVLTALDGDDSVSVIQLQTGSDWATMNVNNVANDWLSAFICPSRIAA
ncbi:hypothetical protein L3X40_17740 [Rhizorhapis sp. SPR117]|nr:hypothetical protein [Rhizorhapis sp. SPR117]